MINNIFSVNKTCLLIFHNKHAFEPTHQTNLNIQCRSWPKLKHCIIQMHAFCRNAIHFELLYSGFLLSNVQTFYTNIQPYIFRIQGFHYFARYGHSVPCLLFVRELKYLPMFILCGGRNCQKTYKQYPDHRSSGFN